jgi:hypothetical protein
MGPREDINRDPRVPIANVTNVDGSLLASVDGYPRLLTINMTNVNIGPPGPVRGLVSIHDPQVCCDLHGQHR